jgi:hypothetical protein
MTPITETVVGRYILPMSAGRLLAAIALIWASQAPPATDIFLVELRTQGGRVQVGAPLNITRRDGYDNQPFFLPDGRALLYTAIGSDRQADIYRYDIAAGRSVRVTATPESEYSPTPLPDGTGFSTVRVERDSMQRLWRFDSAGGDPRVLLPAIKPVGYHAWADDHTLVLFVLGTPPALVLVDTRLGGALPRADTLARDIGRPLQRVPGRSAVSFVQHVSPTEWWIETLDPATREIRRIAPTLEGQEFFTWTPDGSLLSGRGSKLFQWTPGKDSAWVLVADLQAAGLTSITRLAVSPRGDRLAIVAVPGKP